MGMILNEKLKKVGGLLLMMMLAIPACSAQRTPPKTASNICNLVCNEPREPVEVKDGTISGAAKDAVVTNRLKDDTCIRCLKRALGENP